ncbi:hypothetical protein GPX89_02395 [Nocardia sp. ET3-3]|uniref:TPR repeat domain-containing protein n=1 Tax=Nocardia terrae TaxID=2675851 RepID=A0A7K1UP19_9NOCA|nr:hypothetical protein [Nocardia terrae]MVU76092.1 hypothetical protein [Nocardia terrae]
MTTTPLGWLRTADPSILGKYASEWDSIGLQLETVFGAYVDSVTKVNGQYWDGKAATAAQDRASGDQKTVQALADKLTGLAGQARDGETAIAEALSKARGYLSQCDANRWSVTAYLGVIGEGSSRDLAQMNKDLTAAYNAAVTADNAARDALNATRSQLLIAFTSSASLGGDEGKADGKRLVDDPAHMSDAAIQRLIDAGQLTDQQLDDLHNGKPVSIPESQMDYLNQLSRSLDNKSPEEVQAILDKLPPNAQVALKNSLQLVSNTNVTTALKGDSGIPDKGGANLLPKKLEESLTRPDAVDFAWNTTGGPYARSSAEVKLNGVKDNQIIAKIAGGSDPRYRAGSDLDKQVLDVGAKYLGAQVSVEQNPENKLMSFTVDGHGQDPRAALTEGIFGAVGDDKAAVQNLVIDAGTGKPNEQFFHDVLTHQWTDSGDAASKLFSFGDSQPGSVDAHRQASIMSAFGQFVSSDDAPSNIAGGNDKWHLYDIPESGHKTVGDLNPKLVQTLSTGMTPYMNDLINSTHPTNDGFNVTYKGDDGQMHSWTDPSGNNTFAGSKNIFSFMDTNDAAGQKFNAAALDASLRQEIEYGHNPNDAHARNHLVDAGELQGLVDAGLRDEISAHTTDSNKVATDAYNQKKAAYDIITKGLGYSAPIGDMTVKTVTGEQVSKLVGIGGDPLKNAIIGPAPSAGNTNIGLNPPNFDQQSYNVLANTEVPDNLRQQYANLFDANGQLKPWHDLQSMPDSGNGDDPVKDLTTVFNQLGLKDGHESAMRDGYSDVTGGYRKNDGQQPHNGR